MKDRFKIPKDEKEGKMGRKKARKLIKFIIFFCKSDLEERQSWTKYLAQSKEIKKICYLILRVF